MFPRVLSRSVIHDVSPYRMSLDMVPGVGGKSDPSDKPLKPEPTIVTKADITDYAAILVPLVKSLNNDDIVVHMVYKDPSVLHSEVDTMLFEANKLDGREATIETGFGPDEALDPCAYSKTCVLSASEKAAIAIRREAFQRRVDARLMEDHITARCGDQFCMKNAAITAEVNFFTEWREFINRFEKYLDSITGFTVVKSSDFLEMQRLDLEYQWYRREYQKLTSYAPTRHLTITPPPAPGIPWGWIVGLATAATAAYFLGPIVLAVVAAKTASKTAATAIAAA